MSTFWEEVVTVHLIMLATRHHRGLCMRFIDDSLAVRLVTHAKSARPQGRTVDFKNTIVVMTSNLGSADILDTLTAFDPDLLRERVMQQVRGVPRVVSPIAIRLTTMSSVNYDHWRLVWAVLACDASMLISAGHGLPDRCYLCFFQGASCDQLTSRMRACHCHRCRRTFGRSS